MHGQKNIKFQMKVYIRPVVKVKVRSPVTGPVWPRGFQEV